MNRVNDIELSKDEIHRYGRHLLLTEVGLEGQRKLKAASVLIIGAGGLGSPISLYLAAAGVGKIGLVDMDVVEVTNLQRQIIHGTDDLGRLKIDSAGESIRRINPYVQIEGYREKFSSDNAIDIARHYDVVIDCTDNFPTRYLVNDVCVLLNKPNIYGSIFRFDGQISVFWADKGACYRCLYPEPPPEGLVPNCAEGGVLGVLPGIVGTIQANEVIKFILGQGDLLINRLLVLDALGMRFKEYSIEKNPDCPICGSSPTISGLIDYQQFCGVATSKPQLTIDQLISSHELQQRVARNEIQLIDVRSPEEHAICAIDHSLLIPLADLPLRVHELQPDKDIVVYCKSGFRGSKAVVLLNEMGWRNCKNLTGGIEAWAKQVDDSIPRY